MNRNNANHINTEILRADKLIPISLAYAPSANNHLYLKIEVTQGTQLIEAIEQVGWFREYPELAAWCYAHKLDTKIDNKAWWVGVYAEKKLLTYVLKAHDRVEIYRPLSIDPMRKRKKRASKTA